MPVRLGMRSSNRELDREWTQRRGVAFRVIARTGVDANGSLQVGVCIDATPWDGTDVQHAGVKGAATPVGAAAGHGFSTNGCISLMRSPPMGMGPCVSACRGWDQPGTDRVLAIRGVRTPVQTRLSGWQLRRYRPVRGARGRAPSLNWPRQRAHSITAYFFADGFCASFAQESLSVTVRLKTRCSDVLSLSTTK